MLIGGVLTGLFVLGLFFTMLSSSPRREEPVAQAPVVHKGEQR